MQKYTEIFSEYDIEKLGIKFENEDAAKVMDTVASCETTMEVRTVVKKKRNMPWKSRTKPTGSGTKKITLHLPEDIYAKMFGMYVEGYKEGVMVYGTICAHALFSMTALITDEDGNVKLIANPCCSIKSGISKKIETNAETIAEIEIEVAIDPDEDGIGEYSAVVDKSSDESLINNWISNFDAASMCKNAVTE